MKKTFLIASFVFLFSFVLCPGLARAQESTSDCKDVPCHSRESGECVLCCKGQYINPLYPSNMAHGEVDKKFKKLADSKVAAAGASAWLGEKKFARFIDKTSKGSGGPNFEHKYCWSPIAINELPIMKKNGWKLGEFVYNKGCVEPRNGQCAHPTMECTKSGDDKVFTCNFRINEFDMAAGGKCRFEDSAFCPEMKQPEKAAAPASKKAKKGKKK